MKIAVCGVWHVHAPGYTNEALKTESVEVIGFYEEDEALKVDFESRVPVKAFASYANDGRRI